MASDELPCHIDCHAGWVVRLARTQSPGQVVVPIARVVGICACIPALVLLPGSRVIAEHVSLQRQLVLRIERQRLCVRIAGAEDREDEVVRRVVAEEHGRRNPGLSAEEKRQDAGDAEAWSRCLLVDSGVEIELCSLEGVRGGAVVGVAETERFERSAYVTGTNCVVDLSVVRRDEEVEWWGGDVVILGLHDGHGSCRK
jgi:hypothetical protein